MEYLYERREVALQFVKRRIPIEAEQFWEYNGERLAKWCGGRFITNTKPSDPTDESYYLEIPTLEGVMRANVGDYIIKGVRGEFYPCKASIFEETYEWYDPYPNE